MLQTRENGKENIATSCLKESPVYALPCFCKWALQCMLRMGKGHKKNGESPTVFGIALRTLEELKNIEGILIHCSGGTCERA